MQRNNEECMLGCARKDTGSDRDEVIIDDERVGIYPNHAYSLLDVFEIENPKSKGNFFKLMRVRNPWGDKHEWNGAWSDDSDELKEYRDLIQCYIDKLQEDDKFIPGAPDGTFLMTYYDWSRVFNKLFVAIGFSDAWSGRRFEDEWDPTCAGGLPVMPNKKNPAGDLKSWAKNPQYLIKHDIDREIEFLFSLTQPDGRLYREASYPFEKYVHWMNLIIYPCNNGKKAEEFDVKVFKPEWSATKVNHRETTLRIKLPKGTYLVIPSTAEPDKYGKYSL